MRKYSEMLDCVRFCLPYFALTLLGAALLRIGLLASTGG